MIVGEQALTVYWSAPAGVEEATIGSYDLRYIAASEDETLDANWTVHESVWSIGERVHVVEGLTNDIAYDVQVRAVTSEPGGWSAAAQATPAEHGGSREAATELALGTSVGGAISNPGNADYYRFVLTSETGILIFSEGEMDPGGRLTDENGKLIKISRDANELDYNNFLMWDTLQAGTYYLEVTGDHSSTGSYVLVVEEIVDSTDSGDARFVALGTPVWGIIDPGDDVDWFTFTLTEATDVILRGTGFLEFSLHDSQLESVDTVPFNVTRGDGFENLVTLDAGTYYIKVFKRLPIPVLYSLYVLEAVEPGSSLNEAAQLRMDYLAVGNIDPSGDADYFRIDVQANTHVKLLAQGRYLRVYGELLDSSGNVSNDGQFIPSFTTPIGFTMYGDLNPGTYYLKVTGPANPGSSPDTAAYALLMNEDARYRAIADWCESKPSRLSDPLSDPWAGCQWHLFNTGQLGGAAGEDINIEDAWTITQGEGINVAVVDDGLQYDHPDLTPNVNRALNHDFTSRGDVYDPQRSHGTKVGGLIAARDNDIGVRGVAPRATIYNYNYPISPTVHNSALAMTLNREITAVSNNSYGNASSPLVSRASGIWWRAVDTGLAEGYGGLGTVYVWAAGNGAKEGAYANLEGRGNHPGVVMVCAVSDKGRRASYSNMGANLWVCAPSGQDHRHPLTTTDVASRYTQGFAGTSASAPIVSGVAALVRGANNDLSWRDVKLILAGSARKNDADDSSWLSGAHKHGSSTEFYSFSHEYGFGVVDASAAVDLAVDWTPVPAMRTAGPFSNQDAATIPASGTTVSQSVAIDSDIDFTEWVEVTTDFEAPDFRDLLVELVSPSGAVSTLSTPATNCPFRQPFATTPVPCTLASLFRFGSARHLGEDPSGSWTLRVTDRLTGGPANELNSWSVTVYGHKSVADRPASAHVCAATGALTVAWTEPDYKGSSPLTGYEVRHIRSDSADKGGDSAWKVLDVDGADARSYTIDGVTDGRSRDVQVRAVNGSGGGDWSITGRGTPGAANNQPTFAEGDVAVRSVSEDAAAGVNVGSAMGAQDCEGDTLAYSLGDTDGGNFEIDASTGQITTKAPLDYETKSTHTVTVEVSDNKSDAGEADTAVDATVTVTISVGDVDEPPTLVGETSVGYAENGVALVAVFTAVDPEGSSVQWSLGGADSDDFYLGRGPLAFKSSPDFEDPSDADGDSVYEVLVTVSDGAVSNDVAVTVTVSDVDEVGVVSFNSVQPRARTPLSASLSDPDGGQAGLSWAWEKATSSSGPWSAIPGAESGSYVPANADAGSYLRATASYADVHGAGKSVSAVSANRVQAIPNTAPDFGAGSTVRSVGENTAPGAAVGAPVAADDAEDDSLTYSLGGVDAASFLLDSASGQLSTGAVLNFEAKPSYSVTVTATDPSGLSDSIAVTVSVVNVDEPGAVRLSAVQPQAGTVLSASLADPDGGQTGVSWGWETATSSTGPWTAIAGVSSGSYTPVDADVGSYLRATASYADTHGANKTASAVSANAVRAAPVVNTAPDFGSDTATRSIDENTDVGTAVGAPVTADDAEDDPLTYTLSGADAGLFSLDSATGQLSTRVPVDHESVAAYVVTVTASDPSGLSDSIAVTVAVNNLEEPGVLAFSAQSPKVGEVLTATLTDPDGAVSATVWQWSRSTTTSGGWRPITGATHAAYRPTVTDIGSYLHVRVAYNDAHDSGARDRAEAVTAAVTSATDSVVNPQPSPDPAPPLDFAPDPQPAPQPAPGPSPQSDPDPAQADGPGKENRADEFTDLDEAGVHTDAVTELVTEGVLAQTGCENGLLCPSEPITRWEMAVWLVRVIDGEDPDPLDQSRFGDVSAGLWWAGHVERLAELGITLGCATDPPRYCPHDHVTRAQMASFLVRAFELSHEAPAGFTDTTDNIHESNIDALYSAEITFGCSAQPPRYCPHQPTTRAQMASFLTRARNHV